MKKYTILAVLLAAILAVPAFAQSNSATQTPAATRPPLDPTPRPQRSITTGNSRRLLGRANPFARKKYVARQTEPIRDRINELDELTASNTKAIKDTDARAQAGIQLASSKATEADQHAIEAGNKAQARSRPRNRRTHAWIQCSRWSPTSISTSPRRKRKSFSSRDRPY